MDDDVRAVRTLILLLLVSGGLRLAWQSRAGEAIHGAGSPVEVAALLDSATRVEDDEARRSSPLAPGERLDLNSAPPSELDRLPGVGPATADRIVAERESRPFTSVGDLARVSGIGQATLERISPNLMVQGGAARPVRPTPRTTARSASPAAGNAMAGRPAPVNPNTASAEGLQALPGIGPSLAERWIQHRTTAGPFRTPDDLLAIPGIGPATLNRLRPLLAPAPWSGRAPDG